MPHETDLHLGSGHTASLIESYLHTKFHWDRTKNFLKVTSQFSS